MRLHILQHAPFETPGIILDWADEKDFPVRFTRFFLHETLPEPDDFDLLIVMGGPMSLSDAEKYPWLVKEKIFLKKALALGKKMLGICLGAQLLAETLGAKVYQNKQKEIGWFPVRKNPDVNHEILKLFNEETLPAFHWHGNTFDLPEGAIPLFSSEVTKNQAFVWKDRIFALQFHWEVKPENVHLLLKNSAAELADEPFVQHPEEMMAHPALFAETRINLLRFLDFVTIH